jgi:hypothetical protein
LTQIDGPLQLLMHSMGFEFLEPAQWETATHPPGIVVVSAAMAKGDGQNHCDTVTEDVSESLSAIAHRVRKAHLDVHNPSAPLSSLPLLKFTSSPQSSVPAPSPSVCPPRPTWIVDSRFFTHLRPSAMDVAAASAAAFVASPLSPAEAAAAQRAQRKRFYAALAHALRLAVSRDLLGSSSTPPSASALTAKQRQTGQ